MPLLKRVKGGITHYVSALAADGSIGKLTENVANAIVVTKAEAEKFHLHYAGKDAAGLMVEEGVEGEANNKLSPGTKADAEKDSKILELTAEVRRLTTAHISVTAKFQEAAGKLDTALVNEKNAKQCEAKAQSEAANAKNVAEKLKIELDGKVAELAQAKAELEELLTAPKA
jgi:hypothetical protein